MKTKKGLKVPEDLAKALNSGKKKKMWDKLRPSCQREYVEYLVEAKKPETRKNRVEKILKMTKDYYTRHYQK
jgi:uncharacterized protein YdeI (YjbR/CyaY-like superfamily)